MLKTRRFISSLLVLVLLLGSIGLSANAFENETTDSNLLANNTNGDSMVPLDVQDVPVVELNSISNQLVGSTVTVKGSSSSPCYRMSAKYTHNGSTVWLGDVYSNSYSKSFTVSSTGTYTVTLYSRSHVPTNPRSASSSKSITFSVYRKVIPTVHINNIADIYLGDSVLIQATSSTPAYRMSANYVYNSSITWLGDVYISNYSKTFTPTSTGTYTVNVYSRSYPEEDVRSASAGSSVQFRVLPHKQKKGTINEVHVMPISENGLLNTFEINAHYIENYSVTANNSKFSDRSIWVAIKQTVGATTDIVYQTILPNHVSDWRKPSGGSISGGNYAYTREMVSTSVKTYPRRTDATARFGISITSSDRALRPYANDIELSFDTSSD